MLPGVLLSSAQELPEFDRGDLLAILLVDNE